MHSRFINNPARKSSSKGKEKVAPEVGELLAKFPNTNNLIYTDEDRDQWAQKTGTSNAELTRQLIEHETRLQRAHGHPMYNIRTIGFKDFMGETMADPKILELLQRDYPTRPKAIKDAYEIVEIEGKGMGMVAKRDIHVGGVIAVENPVFVMPVVTGWPRNVSKEEMFAIFFERLKPEQREQALALANCKPKDMCGVHEGILRTNGLSIDLPNPLDPGNTTTHSGTFLNISRCNHRYVY